MTHMQLAVLLKTEEMALDQSEAAALAEAAIEVMKYYPVKADPKLLAWGGLFITAGTIYGPRIAAIRLNRQSPPRPSIDPADHYAN